MGMGRPPPILPCTEPSVFLALSGKTPAWRVASRNPVPASVPPYARPSCFPRRARDCLSQGGQLVFGRSLGVPGVLDFLGLSHHMSPEAGSLSSRVLDVGVPEVGRTARAFRRPQAIEMGVRWPGDRSGVRGSEVVGRRLGSSGSVFWSEEATEGGDQHRGDRRILIIWQAAKSGASGVRQPGFTSCPPSLAVQSRVTHFTSLSLC